VTAELYTLLGKINQEAGMTIVMVTHDVQAAVNYAGHILHITGEEYFFGTPTEYTRSDFMKKFFRTGHSDDTNDNKG